MLTTMLYKEEMDEVINYVFYRFDLLNITLGLMNALMKRKNLLKYYVIILNGDAPFSL